MVLLFKLDVDHIECITSSNGTDPVVSINIPGI